MKDEIYAILKHELQIATGCTEPASLAYAASLSSSYLEGFPDEVKVSCCRNILKNVKSVHIPNAKGFEGVEAAIAAGLVAGSPGKKLALLENLTPDDVSHIADILRRNCIHVEVYPGDDPFFIEVICNAGNHSSKVRLQGSHTNVVLVEVDGHVVIEGDVSSLVSLDYSILNMDSIMTYVSLLTEKEGKELFGNQIVYNVAIAEEGVRKEYGASIGRILLKRNKNLKTYLIAMAAAGSDARMGGCSMPVVINSGSGNQGITVSVPVVLYGRRMGFPSLTIYKGLAVPNLIAIYQRFGIGCLSAYCGAINAGVAAVCGIAYMDGCTKEQISCVLEYGLAIASGVICDGAKSSCAAKIYLALDAGFLGYGMVQDKKVLNPGEGIVCEDVDSTVAAVARIGRDGMKSTDKEIVDIMFGF